MTSALITALVASQLVQAEISDPKTSRKLMAQLFEDVGSLASFSVRMSGRLTTPESARTFSESWSYCCLDRGYGPVDVISYERVDDEIPQRRLILDGSCVFDADLVAKTYRKVNVSDRSRGLESFFKQLLTNADEPTRLTAEFLEHAFASRENGGTLEADKVPSLNGNGFLANPKMGAIVIGSKSGEPIVREYGYRTLVIEPKHPKFEYMTSVVTKTRQGGLEKLNWKADFFRDEVLKEVDFRFDPTGLRMMAGG